MKTSLTDPLNHKQYHPLMKSTPVRIQAIFQLIKRGQHNLVVHDTLVQDFSGMELFCYLRALKDHSPSHYGQFAQDSIASKHGAKHVFKVALYAVKGKEVNWCDPVNPVYLPGYVQFAVIAQQVFN